MFNLNKFILKKKEVRENMLLFVILFYLNCQIHGFFQVIQKLVLFVIWQIDSEYVQFVFDCLKLSHVQIVYVIFEYLKDTIVREVTEWETKSEKNMENFVTIEWFKVSNVLEYELGQNRFDRFRNHLILNKMVFH